MIHIQNELGNTIFLDITSVKAEFPSLIITIEGPKSVSKNTLTLLEARSLLTLLQSYFEGTDAH